jgi:hypothetical protein
MKIQDLKKSTEIEYSPNQHNKLEVAKESVKLQLDS